MNEIPVWEQRSLKQICQNAGCNARRNSGFNGNSCLQRISFRNRNTWEQFAGQTSIGQHRVIIRLHEHWKNVGTKENIGKYMKI